MHHDRTCILMAQEPRNDFIEKLHRVLGQDFNVIVCVNEAQMRAAIRQKSPRVFLLDNQFEDDDPEQTQLIERVKTEAHEIPVLILNRNGSGLTGLANFHDHQSGVLMEQAPGEMIKKIEVRHLQSELLYLRKHFVDQLGRLIGSSAVMTKIRSRIPELAREQLPILILGEIGTGKELLAGEIHRQMSRAEAAFISVHPEDIRSEHFESELFGVNGLGELPNQPHSSGYWEMASGGILFIDEIAAVPLAIQIRIDQHLERQHSQTGSSKSSGPAQVRFMAASSSNLEQLVEQGEFYRPLWQKLQRLLVRIPPLREHSDDVPEIAEYLLEKMRARGKCCIKRISPLALFAMQNYSWPGNVRELAALIEAAVVRCQYEEIQLHDLQLLSTPMPASRLDWSPFCLKEAFDLFRHEYFTQLLKAEGGNLAAVAARSGITVKKLARLLNRLGIDPNEYPG